MRQCLNGLPHCLDIVRYIYRHSHSCFHITLLRGQVIWPPQTDDMGFTCQAAILQMLYNLVRMLIYRPFSRSADFGAQLSHPEKDYSSFPYPAMDICIEAARSCALIVDVLIEHRLSNIPVLLHSAHLSATMLLVKVWNLKIKEKKLQAQGMEDFKPSFTQQIEPLLADVNLLLQILERAEPRWPFVSAFLSVDFLPLCGFLTGMCVH
jgi:hypothetical protein